ncbi:FMN-dependent dehydrogenase [Hyaloscypha bicolor E]|uniref:Oxidase FUB9 n=1 Tax=Hyaloscypha bicolor E TaxID=1095630 RepID=A0A2J6T1C8_9HELO|nr:FMN-dependent dehydrogenase [Hyaloscypha bicolor E]PMD56828.1 FMN-dependent dehydrogenase [Hyaloscypha bicolor E]
MANRHAALDPRILTIRDLQESASKILPKMYSEYFNEGSMDMITLRDNEEAYNRYKLRPRILVNVSIIDMSTTIFGTKVSFPLGFAPAAMHKLAHPDGEVATSRAAANNGIAMGLSAWSTTPMEDVIAEGKGNPYGFQVTLLKDRNIALKMVKRAEKSGFKAILLTVDGVVLGKRINEHRNSFNIPEGITFPNIESKTNAASVEASDDGLNYDTTPDWETVIPWLRSNTKLPIWVKGVYTPEDVRLAIQHGLDGVIISNHGGRQLDSAPATLDALRECAPVAAGKIPIAIDGGIRRGTDIFKALALGACFCFVGRVPIWGLAHNGEAGVDLAIKLLMDEFQTTMALAGCKTVKDISRTHLSILMPDGILAKL